MELRSGWVVGQGILASSHRPQFEVGVQLVLSRWTALQLALDQQWGGTNTEEKAMNVYDELLDWFYRRKCECRRRRGCAAGCQADPRSCRALRG